MKMLAVFVGLAVTPLVLSIPHQEVLSGSTGYSQDAFYLTNGSSNSSSFVPDDDVSTFPFDSKSAAFTNIPQFVTNMYAGDADKKPWISNTPARPASKFPWMVARLGNAELTPDPNAKPAEPVAIKTNPRWRWADYWRPLNLYRNLLVTAGSKPTGGYVVKKLLDGLPASDLSTALFPQDVKNLLVANEKVIVDSKQDWVGQPRATRPKEYKPFPGVKVTHAGTASGAAFKQTGAVGPMSLEATFILATQLAGINWQTLVSKIGKNEIETGVYWAGAITPDGKDDQVIEEQRKSPYATRNMGYLSRPGRLADMKGSPDAGFYLLLDIDPKVDGYSNTTKNVFVFAAHLLDQHSRVYIRDQTQLHKLAYATPYEPGTTTPPQIPDTNTKGDGVRFYAHAHAAVMQYSEFMKWMGQKITPGKKGEPMPNYQQLGEMHLYFLLEDEDAVWPRLKWITDNP